jgi:membrane fusion protein (multidrug efflux system)
MVEPIRRRRQLQRVLQEENVTTLESEPENGYRLAERRRMILPAVIILIIVAVVLASIIGLQAFGAKMGKKMMAAAAVAPQTVSTMQASASEWRTFIQATGTFRAVRGADLSAQAAGVVEEIAFDSGNEVPAGKILLRLKPNDDYAKLDQLKAAAELAEQNLKRDKEQFAAQAIAQSNIDSDVSTLKSARAQVAAQEALIEEKIVRAPFAGRLGIRQVDLGQYLASGTAIVTLQALDPILIDFYVPQQALARLRTGFPVSAAVDAFPGQVFSGAVESINSKVDPSSRNVQIRASFHNADKRLIPGMFATVQIADGETRSRITLPQTAITYNPYGDSVFIVEQHGTDDKGKQQLVAQQRFVKLGGTRGDQVAIEDGIKPGEVVVTAGQIKLRNGSAVLVNNDVLPDNSPNPHPPNE